MIEKIKSIKKIAVFNDFDWDKSVLDKNGAALAFKKINVLYGRNYSGKTTLSRIIRALENGKISDKYDPGKSFDVIVDGSSVTQDNPTNHHKTIRVFNEDFVRDNLSFPYNDDGNILSFAVLGEDNNTIQNQIDNIKTELGDNVEGEEKTGLYKDQEIKNSGYLNAKTEFDNASKQLESQLKSKATEDKRNSIKYNSDLYGDQNYNVSKLQNEINQVLQDTYTPISNEKKEELKQLLKEDTKVDVSLLAISEIDISDVADKAKVLVEEKIVKKEKIEELVNADLINWAKRGKELHKQGDKCAFCGKPITSERWTLLNNFFDDTQKKLEEDIDSLIGEITNVWSNIDALSIDKNLFYSTFHTQLDGLSVQSLKENIKKSLDSLKEQLQSKKDDLFGTKTFIPVTDYTNDLESFSKGYNEIVAQNNQFTKELKGKRAEAQTSLRLYEIYNFVGTIDYKGSQDNIRQLEAQKNAKEAEKKNVDFQIKSKEDEVEQLKAKMNDEQKGAEKVKEYLSEFFGQLHLSLRAEKENETDKSYKFFILRDGNPAYNLSEGECNMIAFCYFMAKLEDVSTQGKKPIIWIDDPISSLDSNHIFCVYSLIHKKIVADDYFEQLFISTHNLNFLKYLKRLPDSNKNKLSLIISRYDKVSVIEKMPKYMEEYVTEFNYLFKQIYDCANLVQVDDTNYTKFYNFGNNARKFLEIFLYYKYPDMFNQNNDENAQRERRKLFFGERIEPIYTNRLVNEYSHLCGTFERGESLVDVPEMKTVAQLILDKIKEQDEQQYNALVNSIS